MLLATVEPPKMEGAGEEGNTIKLPIGRPKGFVAHGGVGRGLALCYSPSPVGVRIARCGIPEN